MAAELDLHDVAATSPLARRELQALYVRLWRAENAVLSATMGVMEPMQQYMQDYREPVERPSDQPAGDV